MPTAPTAAREWKRTVMEMYEELTAKLRDHNACISIKTLDDAADAIEKLSRMEHDFRKYISNQVNKTSGVYACCYCKNREAFDEDYGCGCDHSDCDGVNEWEYGTPRKENE